MEKLADVVDVFETAKQGTVLYCSGGKLAGQTKENLTKMLQGTKTLQVRAENQQVCDVPILGFDVMRSLSGKNSVAFALGRTTVKLTAPTEIYM